MTNDDLIAIGFKSIPNSTIMDPVVYPLGRHRHLAAGSVGTPNEILWICGTDDQNDKHVTDAICIHDYDYDGMLTIEKS